MDDAYEAFRERARWFYRNAPECQEARKHSFSRQVDVAFKLALNEALAAQRAVPVEGDATARYRKRGLTPEMVEAHYPTRQHQFDECKTCRAIHDIAKEALSVPQEPRGSLVKMAVEMADRLDASIKNDAHNGEPYEQAILAAQVIDAISTLRFIARELPDAD